METIAILVMGNPDLKENTFFSSTGGGALGLAAAGSSGGNPSFLLLSA
jgi:hypothetical protein